MREIYVSFAQIKSPLPPVESIPPIREGWPTAEAMEAWRKSALVVVVRQGDGYEVIGPIRLYRLLYRAYCGRSKARIRVMVCASYDVARRRAREVELVLGLVKPSEETWVLAASEVLPAPWTNEDRARALVMGETKFYGVLARARESEDRVGGGDCNLLGIPPSVNQE